MYIYDMYKAAARPLAMTDGSFRGCFAERPLPLPTGITDCELTTYVSEGLNIMLAIMIIIVIILIAIILTIAIIVIMIASKIATIAIMLDSLGNNSKSAVDNLGVGSGFRTKTIS